LSNQGKIRCIENLIYARPLKPTHKYVPKIAKLKTGHGMTVGVPVPVGTGSLLPT